MARPRSSRPPARRPRARPGAPPARGPGIRPGSPPARGPGIRPGSPPKRGPGIRPGSPPKRGPGIRPGSPPKRDPRARSGSQPARSTRPNPGGAPPRGPAPARTGRPGAARFRERGPASARRRGPVNPRRPAPAPARPPAPPPAPADPARTLARQPWESLRALIPGAASEQDRVLARLRGFALELLTWNRGISNLISHADEPRLVERHIAESLAGAPFLRELACEHIVDFGSGGGFPAIPLAIAGIGARWTLVESRRNKTLFLRRVVERLELRGIVVTIGRLEVLVESEEAESLQCDCLTSRATMKAAPTLELAARIVRPGGTAVLWKGSGLESELAEAGTGWREDWTAPNTRPIAAGPNSIAIFERRA